MRFRITIDLTRTPKPDADEPEFEHRDTEALVEATRGGDERAHRMGFNPPEHIGMQAARNRIKPPARTAGSQIKPPARESGAL